MKFAVISDIHGNLPALEAAVADLAVWQPDQVIVNGDAVNRGPKSRECLQLIQQKQKEEGWQMLRGNHEDFIIDCAAPETARSGPKFEIIRFACWSQQQLNGELAFLQGLPDQFSWLAPDGSEFRVTHASMRNNRDGLYPTAADDELRRQIAPAPAVFVTGHTHLPFIRRVDETLIVNVGSVGAPFDQDTRPSYGRFTWNANHGWQAQIVRLDYDYSLIEKDYVETGFLTEAGPLTQLMLVELRKGRGLIYRWGRAYEKAVLAGEISLEESVHRLLAEEDNRPYLGAPGWSL